MLVPLGDKLLIEPTKGQEKTLGGIIIPDSAKEKPTEGRVVAVGDGYMGEEVDAYPFTVKKNDTVLFNANAGMQIEEAGKKLIILSESEIIAILED